MKKLIVLLAAAIALAVPTACLAVDFIVGAYPGSFLYSPDAEDFAAGDLRTGEAEEVDGEVSWMPNVRLGIGVDFPLFFLDFTVGGGYAYGGDVYSANFLLGDVAMRFKLLEHDDGGMLITLGAHAGGIYFDPEWKGDVDVELDESTGVMFGPCFTIGSRFVSFSASLDYIHLPVDVQSRSNIVTSDDEFDLSGIALQLGILFRF